MVGKCRQQTVHHRHRQNHQQVDDGVQAQETAAAAAAAESRQLVHEGAGPCGDTSSGCREEGPRGATEAPPEATATTGPAGPTTEALGQRGARNPEAGEKAPFRIHNQLPQHLTEGL